MSKLHMLWRVFPNRISDGKLQFAVSIDPQIEVGHSPPTHIPGIFSNWPLQVSKILGEQNSGSMAKLVLRPDLGGAGEEFGFKLNYTPDRKALKLWNKIFGSDVSVEEFYDPPPKYVIGGVEFSEARLSYDSKALADHQNVFSLVNLALLHGIREKYSQRDGLGTFNSANLLWDESNPLIASFLPKDIGAGISSEKEFVEYIFKNPIRQSISSEAERFSLFHHQVHLVRNEKSDNFRINEFHRIFNVLDKHPRLRRLLGITVDLEISLDRGKFSEILNRFNSGNVRIKTNHSYDVDVNYAIGDKTPWTAYEIRKFSKIDNQLDPPESLGYLSDSRDFFVLSHRDTSSSRVMNDIDLGMIKLGEDKFGSFNHDVDSNSKLARNAFDSLQQMRADDFSSENLSAGSLLDAFSAPQKVTTGIQIARRDLEMAISKRVERSEVIHALLISPGDGGNTVLGAEDLMSGYRFDVKSDRDTDWGSLNLLDQVYTSEALGSPISFRGEEGWKEFGKTESTDNHGKYVGRQSDVILNWEGYSAVSPHPGASVDEDGKKVRVDPLSFLGVAYSASVPAKGFDSLQVGVVYKIRARSVDEVGNSWTLEEASFIQQLASENKFEIDTGPYVRHEPIGSPIFSNIQQTEDSNVLKVFLDNGGKNNSSSVNIFPPSQSDTINVRSGVLNGLNARHSKDIIQRHKKYRNVVNNKDRDVYYIPDPAVGGVAIRFQGPMKSDVVSYGKKPIGAGSKRLAKSVRLKLKSGRDWSIKCSKRAGSIEISVPKGERRIVEISSALERLTESKAHTIAQHYYLDRADYLNHTNMGPYKQSLLSIRQIEGIKESAFTGNSPHVTPAVELTVYNYIPYPKVNPKLVSANLIRKLNDPNCELLLEVMAHYQSTGMIGVNSTFNTISDVREGPKFGHQDLKPIEPSTYVVNQNKLIDHLRGNKTFDANFDLKIGSHKRGELHFDLEAFPNYAKFYKDSGQANRLRSKKSKTHTIVLQATKPPAPPLLAIGLPTRDRSGGRRRNREIYGHSVDLVFERPWFSSGPGEKIAILVPPSSTYSANTVEEDFYSKIDSDPIFNSELPPQQLLVESFSSRSIGGDIIRYPYRVELEDGPEEILVSAAVFDVQFDRNLELPFVNIELEETLSYRPFIELRVCTFQPEAVNGVHLSQPTLIRYFNLQNSRSIRTSISNKYVTVEVSGVAPVDNESPNMSDNVMLATFQEKSRHSRTREGWVDVSKFELRSKRVGASSMIWYGTLEFDRPLFNNLRLLLEEFEIHPSYKIAQKHGIERIKKLVFFDEVYINSQQEEGDTRK